MNPTDFVYKQIFSGALKAGASQAAAHNRAVEGLADYKKNTIPRPGGVSRLIQDRINMAKRDNV